MTTLPIINRHNVSFGYNKTLNNELKNRLKEEDTPLNQVISRLNDICNFTEDAVENVDNDDVDFDALQNLTKPLFALKHALVELVEENFPSLGFKLREIKHYESASKQREKTDCDLWRQIMADELKDMNFAGANKDHFFNESVSSEVYENGGSREALFEISKAINGILGAMTAKKVIDPDVITCYQPKENSPVGFDSIAGMSPLKVALKEKIIDPIKNPELTASDLREYGKTPVKAVLFHGPPGCGKTFITRALSAELKLPLFELKIGKAGSKYINETSVNYEKAFEIAAKTAERTKKPVLLFIDEIDGFVKKPNESSSEEDLKQRGTLLNLVLDARSRNIIVVGATNRYDFVDEAMMQRFEQFYVGLPDVENRKSLLKSILAGRTKAEKFLEDNAGLDAVSAKLAGFTPRDIKIIINNAAGAAIKDGRRDLCTQDFVKAAQDAESRKINENDFQTDKKRRPIGFSSYKA